MKPFDSESTTKISKSGFSTRAVHNGRDSKKQGGMVNPPVYHGSTVVYSTLAELEQSRVDHDLKDMVVYGRFGSSSTHAFENAVAELENGFGALSTSSGLSAVTTSILAFANSGDHVLMVDTVYGPTRQFCDGFLTRMGIELSYYDPMMGAEIESLIQANTTLIFMESPGSITFEIQDVPAIVDVARRHNIKTVIDNSWATPMFYQPLNFGVNVSVISATKYIAGHADAMIGLIVSDESNFYTVKNTRDHIGHVLAPDDVFLGMRGLRTLGIRAKHHEQQGLAMANWLVTNPHVTNVLHPALENCPGHEIWKRDFTGSTGLFSFILPSRPKSALADMVDHMELFAMGFSWGGFESLLVPQYPQKSRSATTWTETGQVFRVHVGLEDIDDLISDLDQAINRYMNPAHQ